jgi:hypothetical protein
MVKLPPDYQPRPGDDLRTQLLHDFGALIAMWGQFEIAVEAKIGAITGIKPLYCSIVVGPMNSGAKRNTLYSLLREEGDGTVTAAVKNLVSFAKRNALIHGVVGGEPDSSRFAFFYREVKEKYEAKRLVYTAEEFHQHFLKFRQLHHAAMVALGFDSEDRLNEYVREVGFDLIS